MRLLERLRARISQKSFGLLLALSGLSGLGNFSTGDVVKAGGAAGILAAAGGGGNVGTLSGEGAGLAGSESFLAPLGAIASDSSVPFNVEQIGFLSPLIGGIAPQIFSPTGLPAIAPQGGIGPRPILPAPQPSPSPIPPGIGKQPTGFDFPVPSPQPFVNEGGGGFRPQPFDSGGGARQFDSFERAMRQGGDFERVQEDLRRGVIPTLTGADPEFLPSLDSANRDGVEQMPHVGTAGTAAFAPVPCLSCQMSEAERAQLLDSLPPDAVEVSFMCPSAEHAEMLSRGDPNHGCYPV